jgi:hypothetical protein
MHGIIKKTVVGALLYSFLLFYIAPSQAGLIWFSRANCANNESITWDWPGNNYTLRTRSFHTNLDTNHKHDVIADWDTFFWSRAIHYGEGFGQGNWLVTGNHWRFIPSD